MKKSVVAIMMMVLTLSLVACGKKEDENIIGGADEPTTIYLPANGDAEESESAEEKSDAVENSSEAKESDTTEKSDANEVASADDNRITDDEALLAIQKYCYESNPELENIVNAGEYIVYWEIESSDESQIVVLYRSYTAALVRYYIDPVTGDTYVTEFVQGITEEEERTDESFNVRDYLD